MPTMIATLAIAAALIGAMGGGVYRILLARDIRRWFGEESRRDHDARRRRRLFEWRCGQVLVWFYICGVCGVVRGLVPELLSWALGAQIVALNIAALFAWGATVRFREPFAD